MGKVGPRIAKWLPREELIGMSSATVKQTLETLVDESQNDPLIARLLVLRGHHTALDAKAFLSGSLANLPDPFSMKGVTRAATRIVHAITQGEKLLVWGDFDCDGQGASAMVTEFLRLVGADIDLFIPSRHRDGYGLASAAIKDFTKRNYKCIITVDCGISNIKEALLAKELNVSLIITDHHQVPKVLPEAYAIINPHQEGCLFPDKNLCGAGVAFFLIAAVRKLLREQGYFNNIPEPDIRNLLDICALSTIADLVPLTGVNRILARAGLSSMQQGARVGIDALRRAANIKKISCGTVAFGLAPRLNASGRLEDANLGAKLLLETNPSAANQQALHLDLINRERQEIEKVIFAQAEEKIAAGESGSHSIVLSDSRWNEGVIGIVASRLVEKYHVPTILIFLNGNEGKGSCRSIAGFNLFENLSQCKELLTKFGGHAMAAGLGIQQENIPTLAESFNNLVQSSLSDEDLTPKAYYDAELCVSEISENIVYSLRSLEPFGMGNPSPTFVIYSAKAVNVTKIGADKTHLKFSVEQDGFTVNAIAFQMGHLFNSISDQYVDLLFSLGINEFRGNSTLQLEVKSLRLAQTM